VAALVWRPPEAPLSPNPYTSGQRPACQWRFTVPRYLAVRGLRSFSPRFAPPPNLFHVGLYVALPLLKGVPVWECATEIHAPRRESLAHGVIYVLLLISFFFLSPFSPLFLISASAISCFCYRLAFPGKPLENFFYLPQALPPIASLHFLRISKALPPSPHFESSPSPLLECFPPGPSVMYRENSSPK